MLTGLLNETSREKYKSQSWHGAILRASFRLMRGLVARMSNTVSRISERVISLFINISSCIVSVEISDSELQTALR